MKETQSLQVSALFCLALVAIFATHVAAQSKNGSAASHDQDDVVRVNADLVQTRITVVDKKGRFVGDLPSDQFQLLVDGKPRAISLIEQVVEGKGAVPVSLERTQANANPEGLRVGSRSYMGRTVVFFLDDFHLAPQSVERTRQMIAHYIENEMGPQDQSAIASSSGQIGFLQQFTNNKTVLRTALSRVVPKPYVVRGFGTGSAPMTEYMALTIENKSDENVKKFYIEECLKQGSNADPHFFAALYASCETQVKNSARGILMQSAAIIQNTYDSLESLIRTTSKMQGRKLAFFVSDGFLLDTGPRNGSPQYRLRKITDAAQQAGVVFYTVDAKGLVSGALDATNSIPVDANGRLESALLREIPASQDPLNALAADTGGEALRNQSGFEPWVHRSLAETSSYYVLAWRPETDEQKIEKYRKIEVSIAGRPELVVRTPRGFLTAATVGSFNAPATGSESASPAKIVKSPTPEVEIQNALTSATTSNGLPIRLALSYLNTPENGMVLTASMQVPSDRLDYGFEGKTAAEVQLEGVVLNDRGKVVDGFKNRLKIEPLPSEGKGPANSAVIYNQREVLPPGLYQVRVAARDSGTKRIGTAMEWIEIPEFAKQRLTLSSVLVGGQVVNTAKRPEGSQHGPQVQFSIDRRFSHQDNLNFWIFIYNAMKSGRGAPDLSAQVEVFRDSVSVIKGPERKLATTDMPDLLRIPYGGSFPLKSLAVGRYELRIKVNDRVANIEIVGSTDFEVK
jgi:VWFA-related protein